MIYVPTNLENNNYCYTFIDTNIIREYKSTQINSLNDYTDYNTGNHYTSYSSSELMTIQPSCIDHNSLTNDFYYRNDFSHILVIFFIMLIIIFYLPYKIIMRFYRKGR